MRFSRSSMRRLRAPPSLGSSTPAPVPMQRRAWWRSTFTRPRQWPPPASLPVLFSSRRALPGAEGAPPRQTAAASRPRVAIACVAASSRTPRPALQRQRRQVSTRARPSTRRRPWAPTAASMRTTTSRATLPCPGAVCRGRCGPHRRYAPSKSRFAAAAASARPQRPPRAAVVTTRSVQVGAAGPLVDSTFPVRRPSARQPTPCMPTMRGTPTGSAATTKPRRSLTPISGSPTATRMPSAAWHAPRASSACWSWSTTCSGFQQTR